MAVSATRLRSDEKCWLKASKKDLFDKLIGGLGGDFDLSQHFSSLRSLVALTATTESDEIQEPYTID